MDRRNESNINFVVRDLTAMAVSEVAYVRQIEGTNQTLIRSTWSYCYGCCGGNAGQNSKDEPNNNSVVRSCAVMAVGNCQSNDG